VPLLADDEARLLHRRAYKRNFSKVLRDHDTALPCNDTKLVMYITITKLKLTIQKKGSVRSQQLLLTPITSAFVLYRRFLEMVSKMSNLDIKQWCYLVKQYNLSSCVL
jgi:hypothetical protein